MGTLQQTGHRFDMHRENDYDVNADDQGTEAHEPMPEPTAEEQAAWEAETDANIEAARDRQEDAATIKVLHIKFDNRHGFSINADVPESTPLTPALAKQAILTHCPGAHASVYSSDSHYYRVTGTTENPTARKVCID